MPWPSSDDNMESREDVEPLRDRFTSLVAMLPHERIRLWYKEENI